MHKTLEFFIFMCDNMYRKGGRHSVKKELSLPDVYKADSCSIIVQRTE